MPRAPVPRLVDWDDAYANVTHIPGAERFPPAWSAAATAFRERLGASGRARLDLGYGAAPRQRLDLFLPATEPIGLIVFVHGGYWRAFDRSSWSHLAAGATERGWAVAMPSYTLCPEA
ncbi:MAG: alpha/beta hydrolase, partial [Alphaproteobacteria bacterium]|nr:alpha/beta hydrolase [Alphaproteobacteria bacterium]